MKGRPICVVCLLYILIQGMILIMAGGGSLVEIPASSIFFSGEECEIVLQGQVYQKSNTSNLQQIYLTNNSVSDSKILIYCEQPIAVSIGQTVRLVGVTQRFETAHNPGNFDQALYYAKQDIYGVVWCKEVLFVGGETDWFKESLHTIKTEWKRALISCMGERTGAVLSAMLLAEKGEMDGEIKELYQKNGIGHVLAISGLHISFIGLGLYMLFKKTGIGYLGAGLLSIAVLGLYVGMIGFSVSVFRAFFMLLLRIIADMTGRVYDMMTALWIAAAVTVTIEPLYLTDAGFYLSYGAVLGILLIIPPMTACFRHKGKVLASVISSVSVNVALFPVLLWFYFEFPIYSVVWNLFVIPLMSFVLGFGMAGSLLYLLCRPVGILLLWVCKWILLFYEWTMRIGNNLPMARLVLGKPNIWMIFLYYAVLFLILLGIPKLKKRWKRKAVWVLLVCVITVMSIPETGNLEITMLSVGQGDCIFLRGPDGKTYLIDGGSSDVNQLSKYRVEPFLKYKGVGTLDYVFLTHGDSDHCNGVEEMLERKNLGVAIRYLVLPVNYREDDMLRRIAEKAILAGCKVMVMQAGDSIVNGGLCLTCIQPSKGDDLDKNAGSLVLEVCYGQFSMLCTGDVEKEGEELLLQKIRGRRYDVLKVAHHGSIYSTSEEFLESVRPKIALISSGKDNRYQHPHEEILRRLERRGCQIFQTAKNGAVTIMTDGNSLTIYHLPFRL